MKKLKNHNVEKSCGVFEPKVTLMRYRLRVKFSPKHESFVALVFPYPQKLLIVSTVLFHIVYLRKICLSQLQLILCVRLPEKNERWKKKIAFEFISQHFFMFQLLCSIMSLCHLKTFCIVLLFLLHIRSFAICMNRSHLNWG